MEVFGQKHRRDHAHTVVHVPRGEEFAHAGIDDGEAGGSGFPAVEMGVRSVPW